RWPAPKTDTLAIPGELCLHQSKRHRGQLRAFAGSFYEGIHILGEESDVMSRTVLKPSRVATHSLLTGTSFWITSMNSTGGGPGAACCLVSHPDKQIVWTKRARANRNGFAFITHAPQSRSARPPSFVPADLETRNLAPHARGRDKQVGAHCSRMEGTRLDSRNCQM